MSEEITTITMTKKQKAKLDLVCPKGTKYGDFIEAVLDKKKKEVK